MPDTTVDSRPVQQPPPPPPPPKVEPKPEAANAAGNAAAVPAAVVEGTAHAQQNAGERAAELVGATRGLAANDPPEPGTDVGPVERARIYEQPPTPAASAEDAVLKPTTEEGRSAVTAALASRAGLDAEQAFKAQRSLDPAAIQQRATHIQTQLVHGKLPEGSIDTAYGRVSYSAAERDTMSKVSSENADERAKAIETAQTVSERSARELALDTAFGGPDGRARVEAAHQAMSADDKRALDALGAAVDKVASEPGFGDGFNDGVKDAVLGLVDAAKTGYDVMTDPETQQKLQDVTDALNNPETRGPVIEAFRKQAGAGVEEFTQKPENYVAGYLTGSSVAGLGAGKVGRYAADMLSDGVVTAARTALDVARRAEVKQEGIGSNGGNISVSLRPHTASVDPAKDRIASLEKLSKSERRLLADNPIDNPRAFTTDFLKAGPHVKASGTNKHIQITADPNGNVLLSSSQASGDQVRAASLRLRGDPQFRQRLIQETEAGLQTHGANLTAAKKAEAQRLIDALRRFDVN